jgi:hypothetical protein
VIRDPIPLLQGILLAFLREHFRGRIETDGIIGRGIPWRPHIYERSSLRAWYVHPVPPLSESWVERIRVAKDIKPKLKIGIAAVEQLLSDERFLLVCHELDAAILPLTLNGDTFLVEEVFPSVEDYISSTRIKLSADGAEDILDRALSRALSEPNRQRKGVLLELLMAALLSQVDGFEVASVGVANRSQQMDVLVHNRNTGGALGLSPIVLAEAKNWKDPVDTTEYAAFVRKLQSRHDRARLGYLVTTSRFTAGVTAERRRESMNQTLVVLVDGKVLPTLWRTNKSITDRVERITISATVGS